MNHQKAFKAQKNLISDLGEGNAHLVWSMAMYLDEPDTTKLAADCLTDGCNDKKIDFLCLDYDNKRIVFSQGYYSSKTNDSAPSNKASDLNTAAAWLFSGQLKDVPEDLASAIDDCRKAIAEGEVESIELLYVHNLPESVNVAKELQTVASHLKKSLPINSEISVNAKELGLQAIERLYATQESSIEVSSEITCPVKIEFEEKGPSWSAGITSVPGIWLNSLFKEYGDKLFSANYRGFLGISKRKKINSAIRQTAETEPENFWVFNNGITVLTMGYKKESGSTKLTGISIINGAQTTGSLGWVDVDKHDLKTLRVFTRIICCDNQETVQRIVRYNNTQNEITTWDQYSNSEEQKRIALEFKSFGHDYSLKRGFGEAISGIGIEIVAQPLLAFQGDFRDANRGKNSLFERKAQYSKAFENKKARHILFVYTLAKAIDEKRIELKLKHKQETLITIEETHLNLVRNLRFKYFFMALVARVLEPIVGFKVDKTLIGFTTESTNANNKTLVELIAAWSPVVNALMSFVTTQLQGDISDKLADENTLQHTADHVGLLIHATRSNLPFDDFCKLVSPQ